jgi:hypothetical protein
MLNRKNVQLFKKNRKNKALGLKTCAMRWYIEHLQLRKALLGSEKRLRIFFKFLTGIDVSPRTQARYFIFSGRLLLGRGDSFNTYLLYYII